MILFLLFEEQTDLQPVSFVEEKANILIDAVKNPYKPRPEGEDPLGQIAQESVHLPSHDLILLSWFSACVNPR